MVEPVRSSLLTSCAPRPRARYSGSTASRRCTDPGRFYGRDSGFAAPRCHNALKRQVQYLVDEPRGEGGMAHQQAIEHGGVDQIECNIDVEVPADLAVRHRVAQK